MSSRQQICSKREVRGGGDAWKYREHPRRLLTMGTLLYASSAFTPNGTQSSVCCVCLTGVWCPRRVSLPLSAVFSWSTHPSQTKGCHKPSSDNTGDSERTHKKGLLTRHWTPGPFLNIHLLFISPVIFVFFVWVGAQLPPHSPWSLDFTP